MESIFSNFDQTHWPSNLDKRALSRSKTSTNEYVERGTSCVCECTTHGVVNGERTEKLVRRIGMCRYMSHSFMRRWCEWGVRTGPVATPRNGKAGGGRVGLFWKSSNIIWSAEPEPVVDSGHYAVARVESRECECLKRIRIALLRIRFITKLLGRPGTSEHWICL